MKATAILIGAALALCAANAMAQAPNAINVNGVVDKIDADSISVKPEAGAVETFKLSPKLVVLQIKKATLADIKPNDYVASAAVMGADGKLHSTELRIFPEVMRGLGEGQRPMNDARGQTMTNATVTGAAVVGGSNDLKVKFSGGESELIVDPGVPVIRIDPVDRSLVVAGVKVRAQGVRGDDGAVVNRVTIQ